MHVTRYAEAQPYDAPNHHGVRSVRLQGGTASPSRAFWCGVSEVLPGGGATQGAAPLERMYLVLEGEVTVVTAQGETVLGPMDSCLIGANEARRLENRSRAPARMVVVMENGAPAK
jgi:mannose-6-phosphate isomerase-like protein (cupin superfamily)